MSTTFGVPSGELLQNEIFTTDFDSLDYNDAVRELALLEDSLYLVARAFFNGDHWQKGDAWIGPHPDADDTDGATTWDELERGFVSHPAIEEVVNRHRDTVIGQEPYWTFVPRRPMAIDEKPKPDEQKRIEEVEALLTAWWDDKDVINALQLCVEDFLLGGRGVLRIFVPVGNLQINEAGESVVPTGKLEDSLEKIWVSHVPADEGGVPRDPITMERFGIFRYEIVSGLDGAAMRLAELTYLEGDKTIIRTVVQSDAATAPQLAAMVEQRAELNLGRRITMYEMRSKSLVSQPIIDNQKMLNKTLTMLSRNVDLGGFLERVILNGQMPGEFVTGPDGKKVFQPHEFKVGAGTTNMIAGVQVGVKDDGSPVLADPRIQYRDPVDVTSFDRTHSISYRNVLSGARQLHVLIAADANASGEARKQARDDFTKSTNRSKTRLDGMGRWLLETALQMAATFSGTPDAYNDLRAIFDTQLDPGPLSAEDRAAIVAEYQSNLRSQEGSMALLGVDDTAGERTRINAEQEADSQLTPGQKIAIERAGVGLAADKLAMKGQVLPPDPIPPNPGLPPAAQA